MNQKILQLVGNIEQVIVGKKLSVIKVVLAMLCNGHVLIEDVPGTGKTQLILALSQSVAGVFHRLQLTPDIMPSDIIGYTMIDPETKKMVYREGVVNCNFLLADEINRASPKVQSGLLEVMEENQISVDGKTYPLPEPFITFATQNPVENYGTYHLPEAQMDRFFMRLSIGYPNHASEMEILNKNSVRSLKAALNPVWSIEDVTAMQKEVEQVRVQDEVKKYILDLVQVTRSNENVSLAISPRGSISLFKAAKGLAYMDDRDYATPNDVRAIAVDILAHRMILSRKGKVKFKDSRAFINYLLENISVTS